jgi:metal-dependent amidase/aminoacylase/carboxypeptidase family protein
VVDAPPIMASEDFGIFGLEGHKIPTTMFWLGAMEPARFAAAQAAGTSLPGPHTSRFQPDPGPTLRTGVKAMSAAAIAMLK